MFSLRMTMFRQPEHHCRVWPWLRLRPSSQGIPASQVYPAQKAKVTCCRRHRKAKQSGANELHIDCKRLQPGPARICARKQTCKLTAKQKTPPLGNLMIHKIKKCLQHQRLLIIYRSHQVVIIVCLLQSLVTLMERESSTAKIILHWKKSFPLCKTEMTPNTVLVFINLCLFCGTVQSRPVCLFENAGLARWALSVIYS